MFDELNAYLISYLLTYIIMIIILLTSSKNQIYEFRIPNISCCLTTFLYTLSLTEATRKQSVYISIVIHKSNVIKKIVVNIGDSEFVNLVFR